MKWLNLLVPLSIFFSSTVFAQDIGVGRGNVGVGYNARYRLNPYPAVLPGQDPNTVVVGQPVYYPTYYPYGAAPPPTYNQNYVDPNPLVGPDGIEDH
jgi:hypothetical protein